MFITATCPECKDETEHEVLADSRDLLTAGGTGPLLASRAAAFAAARLRVGVRHPARGAAG